MTDGCIEFVLQVSSKVGVDQSLSSISMTGRLVERKESVGHDMNYRVYTIEASATLHVSTDFSMKWLIKLESKRLSVMHALHSTMFSKTNARFWRAHIM